MFFYLTWCTCGYLLLYFITIVGFYHQIANKTWISMRQHEKKCRLLVGAKTSPLERKNNKNYYPLIEYSNDEFQDLSFYCSSYNYPPNFLFAWKFWSLPWFSWSIIPWSRIGKMVISNPLLDLTSCSHSHVYETCVIFWDQYYYFSCKWKFVLLQGEIFMHMSFSHYIDMFDNHFMHSYHEACCINKGMFCMF